MTGPTQVLLAVPWFQRTLDLGVSLEPDVPGIRALYSSERLMRLLEDGGKLLGIVTWTACFVQTSARALGERRHPCQITSAP